jgi:A1 cistron-splicing factor AAR2
MAQIERAAVLLLDLPNAALAGIDLISFTATPKFAGVKQIPPGWHFVFTSVNSSLSIRHGAWFNVPKPGPDPLYLSVKRWNAANEDLVQEANEHEVRRLRANLSSLWNNRMITYRQKSQKEHGESSAVKAESSTAEAENEDDDDGVDWRRLTERISANMLDRVVGSHSPDHWTLTTANRRRARSQLGVAEPGCDIL